MFIDSAKNTLRIAEQREQFFIIEMRNKSTMEILNHRYMTTPDDAYCDVARLWSEAANADVTPAMAEQILSLYPRERIAMVLAGNVEETDIRDQLMDVFAHFFLGCTWPTYGDQVDSDRFRSLLQHQIQSMGL